jgi:hypothetical protein
MTDFEAGINNAWLSEFPNIELKNCFFHNRQSSNRRVKQMKSSIPADCYTRVRREVLMLNCLAYLPSDEIYDAFLEVFPRLSDNGKRFALWFKSNYIGHRNSESR